ncbi:sugar phosphate isomerase/epimerase [Verrucomicrobiaceae bacterium R5-34]|nr:sugar phosphate isomerase/epimerase [Verrucomicrobiaceae bacterium R5-34]
MATHYHDKTQHSSRRRFLKQATVGGLALSSLGSQLLGAVPEAQANAVASLDGRLFKTLKFGMIKGGSVLERFQMAKEAGFSGVELNVPGLPIEEANAASAATGITVDGAVGSSHWAIRHSDPDPAVRAKALEKLIKGIEETRAVGGSTILLVVGHGKDGSHEEVWERSIANIKLALPHAAKHGVTIVIENVWNHFCYDHQGDSNQTAELLAKYVDAFQSPFVGLQFDIGNHWKYGSMGDWIRLLGKRIVKLDVKGFSRQKNKFSKIGEGDIDFADVRKALVEINYHGWCAAEVGGGDLTRLKEISKNMDQAFGLTK